MLSHISMELCNICEDFDIRALLLKSAIQIARPSGITDRNLVDAEDYRPPIPSFYRHQKSIVALKTSSEHGCSLCNLIWFTWIRTLNKTELTDDWLDATFPGPIFIGCSGWTTSREGLPYVTVTQQLSSGQSRSLCSLEAFADRECVPPDGRHILGRTVYEDPASPEGLDVATGWLQTCLEDHHDYCQASRPVEGRLPTRVIEVGHKYSHPRLLETKDLIGNWIALSYCWGGNSAFVLTDRTAEDLRRGVPLTNFPATLRDSVIITRHLGLKYLWIDALCIKQDSLDDWASEAAKMREVYAGALLTIAAASSQSTNAGIFSNRKRLANRACVEWKSGTENKDMAYKIYLRSGSEIWDNTLQHSPLTTRGWTLQEGLLAPRTLSYGPQQMIWECCRHQVDESGRATIPTQDYRGKAFIQDMIEGNNGSVNKDGLGSIFKWKNQRMMSHRGPNGLFRLKTPPDPYERWYDIVREFTRRSLTKDTDTLPALGGLAREFQRITKDSYCAGLWKKDIICGLLWDRLPAWSKDGATRWDNTKRSEYLAPSWSWAGVLGKQANFPTLRARKALFSKSAVNVAKVLQVCTVQKGPDQFGQVISGKITLKVPFYQLMRQPTSSNEDEAAEYVSNTSPFLQHVFRAFRDTGRIDYEFIQQHVPTADQRFAIIELVRWAKAPGSGVPGMELMALESTGASDGEYRRIGLFSLRKEDVPDPEAVGLGAYNGIIAENRAWTEVVDAKWQKRRLTIV